MPAFWGKLTASRKLIIVLLILLVVVGVGVGVGVGMFQVGRLLTDLDDTRLQLAREQEKYSLLSKEYEKIAKETFTGPTLTAILNDFKRAQEIKLQNQPRGAQELQKITEYYTGMPVHFTDPISMITETSVTLIPSTLLASNAYCMVGNNDKLLTLRNGDEISISGYIGEIDEGFWGGFTININDCKIHWE